MNIEAKPVDTFDNYTSEKVTQWLKVREWLFSIAKKYDWKLVECEGQLKDLYNQYVSAYSSSTFDCNYYSLIKIINGIQYTIDTPDCYTFVVTTKDFTKEDIKWGIWEGKSISSIIERFLSNPINEIKLKNQIK